MRKFKLCTVTLLLVGLVVVTSLGLAGKAAKTRFFGNSIWGMYGSWEEAYITSGGWYADDHGYGFATANAQMRENKQVRDINNFIMQGVDAILVGPTSSTAPIPAVEDAMEKGIPVAAVNSDLETENLSFSLYFGNVAGCKKLGEEIVEYLKNKVKPFGEVKGTIIDVQGDLGMSIGQEREEGFRQAVEGYDGIKVEAVRADFQAGPAQRKVYNKLQALGEKVDAIFAANGASALGAVKALDRAGLLVPRGEKGHIFVAAMDGSPTVLDLLEEGSIDRGMSQPTQFYLPLSIYFLNVVLDKGEEALPDYGETITADEVNITGKEHRGVDPWKTPIWAPIHVKKKFGHRWFETAGKLLTPENYDDPTNWGNIFR